MKLNKNFLLYLAGRMISDTGTSIQMVVMPLYIIDAGGSAATIGLFSFLSLIPALFMYPFAGVLGDRLNRKMIMVSTDIASGAIILGLAALSFYDSLNLTILLVGQIFISLLNGLFDPATKGMLPQLVAEEELAKANSKVASLRGLSVLLGPIIGAALYGGFGISLLFLINGVSYLLSGLSEVFIGYKYIKRKATTGLQGIFKDLSAGVGFIFSNKLILTLCCFFLVLYAFIQPIFSVVLPLFYKTSLGYSETHYGYLQSMLVLGMLIGSIMMGLAYGKEGNMLKPLRFGCMLLITSLLIFSVLMFPKPLSILGNASLQYFVLLAAILCLFSAANMFINVPVQTFIQSQTTNEYMSRVFSIVGMITRGGMPFGALMYGFVLERVSIHWTVMSFSILMIFFIIGFQARLSKYPT